MAKGFGVQERKRTHPLLWHKCERWWQAGFLCPYSGNSPTQDEVGENDEEDSFIPIGERKPKEHEENNRKIKEVVEEPLSLVPPIPGLIPLPRLLPFPTPERAPQPSPAGQPAGVPQHAPHRIPRGAEPFTASQGTYQRQRESQELSNWGQLQTRLRREATQIGQLSTSSAQAIQLPPSLPTSSNTPSGGARAELESTAISEAALAKAYSMRQGRSSSGSREKRQAVEEAERVVRGAGKERTDGQPAEEEDLARARQRVAHRKAAQVLAIAGATAAGAEVIRRAFGGGGGASPGSGSANLRGRGGFIRRAPTFRGALQFRMVNDRQRSAIQLAQTIRRESTN